MGTLFLRYFVQVVVPNPAEPKGEVWTWLEGCGVALAMLCIEMLLVLSQLPFFELYTRVALRTLSAIVIYGEVNIIPVIFPFFEQVDCSQYI